MFAVRTLHNLEIVMLRRMSLMNSTAYADLSSSSIRQYIDLNPPITVVSGRRSHINATPLTSNTSPSSLKDYHHMNATDKSIWDRAYLNEYLGLTEDTNTWQYITENEYHLLRPITGNALTSMAISTIKKDENGNSVRAKYRIVVLGNLDPHAWTKNGCFAPVMSQLEFRSLIASAVRLQRSPKSGDFQNAFCQSTLPPDEQYIIRPPHNCPLTLPRTYLRLLKTLYGLK